MNKLLLESLIRLFAYITAHHPSIFVDNVKLFIQSFLRKEFSPDILNDYLHKFNEYHGDYSSEKRNINRADFNGFIQKYIADLQHELNVADRFLLLIRLLFFHKFLFKYQELAKGTDSLSMDWITSEVAEALNIGMTDYTNCKSFIFERLYDIKNRNDLLVVGKKDLTRTGIHFIERSNLQGNIYFQKITGPDLFLFYYKGSGTITIDDFNVFPENIYIFHLGSKIDGETIEPLYYNEVAREFESVNNVPIELKVLDLEFHFPRSHQGIHHLSLRAESGQMIGVIGKSGVGKSTLINLLTGSLKPEKGEIRINNYDIFKDSKHVEGLIGYIPQDDLLIEELTVFENLYFSAQLCLGDYRKDEIVERVGGLLKKLNLDEVKDLKVGTPLNKFISGGQRKRLNIALELIREPWILYADEPTSGLAISDADEIMELLTHQAASGRIVFANVHQPSSEHFKMFDKILVLDKNGYPVYFGHPVDAINYFNKVSNKFVKLSDRCQLCGNVNHETIFNILSEKKVDRKGFLLNERKIPVKQWHNYYLKNLPERDSLKRDEKGELPETRFNKPDSVKQFFVFFKRNVLSKISSYQYVAFSLLITPVLAAILALLTRSGIDKVTGNYTYSLNDNIPAYLFMCVIVSLFVGLVISAEEVFRDRKMLKREQFLNLNKTAYLLSKLFFLFFVSLVQTVLYVVIGNAILQIEGMFWQYTLILFTTFCFANTLGLLISALFNSVVVIYILVPLLIVPQILLSGTIVQYDQLNEKVVSEELVPVIGDFMVSRWSYEALVVTQFKENEFQRHYFTVDQKISNLKYDLLFVLAEVEGTLEEIKFGVEKGVEQKVKFIQSSVKDLDKKYPVRISSEILQQLPEKEAMNLLNGELRRLRQNINKKINHYMYQKDSITNALVQQFGGIDHYNQFKNKYYNNRLAEMVLNRNTFEPVKKSTDSGELIRKIEPIYQKPVSQYGRAHFYSPLKYIGHWKVNTFYFNIFVMWLISFVIFIILVILFQNKNLIIK
ncbi:MAG: ATP-binding cassette domain-containing protein [Bacteroidales bacterium]|jgi:ABC-type multidrug transport system ATPase subunit|nr:ATP-binding cassette domain-containing protein [Bacteroidales bacterium]